MAPSLYSFTPFASRLAPQPTGENITLNQFRLIYSPQKETKTYTYRLFSLPTSTLYQNLPLEKKKWLKKTKLTKKEKAVHELKKSGLWA